MNLKRIIDIYDIIKDRLPATYPRPKLAFFEDEDSMLDNNDLPRKEDETVYAIVNPNTYTINLPLSMVLEHTGRSNKTIQKTVPLNKFIEKDIALTLLHEIGHLYAGERYGYNSKQYGDEKYCDKFAERWCRVLIKERLIYKE